MKPHHRASLFVGCLGLLFLYLPDGLRVVRSWPSRPVLATVLPVATTGPARALGLVAAPLPRPEGPAPPEAEGIGVEDLVPERPRDLYPGGQ